MFHPAAVGVDGRVNLFVGNLPYRVRWQDLKDLFRRAGTVLRADVSLDPQSNRSRGHGTVLMGSQEDGIKAIELFNGYNWQTRILEVRPDRLPPEYEPHPYVPSSMFGPAPVAAGPMYGVNTARRESGRPVQGGAGGFGKSLSAVDATSGGLGVGPAPSSNAIVENNGQFAMFPSTQAGAGRPAGYSPFYSVPGAGAGGGGGGGGGGAGYHSAYDNGRGSLSRSVLQGNFSSSLNDVVGSGSGGGGNAFLGVPRNQQQMKRPAPPIRQDTLGGRLLYVENLPPGMQWQELKDLFRMSGGTVVRADIAQGERGRGGAGYGTVLFASEMDAMAAVERFDGADYQGRQLQVRQDKTQSGPIPALTPTERAQPPQFPEPAVPSSASSHGADTTGEQEKEESSARDTQIASHGNRTTGTGLSGKRGNLPPLRLGNNNGGGGYGPFGGGWPFDHGHSAQNGGLHQGRMGMGPMGANTMSPAAGRGMPPMTPSMPGFTFHAYPSTPPLMPMGFLSPGLGPFSPALNSPQSFVFNPFMNAAPGAPLSITPTGPMPPNNNSAMNAPYAMTPGAPLTVDPTSQHHPAHPDYFPPQSPISHVPPMGYSGFGGAMSQGAPTEEKMAEHTRADEEIGGSATPRRTPVGVPGVDDIASTLSRLAFSAGTLVDSPSDPLQAQPGISIAGGFSTRASFVSTRPEGLSAAILVDRDRRASMNDVGSSGNGFSKNDLEDKSG
ncbi:hypothetical protein QFC19_004953 [Naganishia cerealis]|uniref:Uncharacterized protein n=1 Tax=Naganishia cerealis TaxID=610337 RepID=A0ACC2VSZ3_9TREE|nr:hypothetical protein QFC19_004953 [Naganishia cerealis]